MTRRKKTREDKEEDDENKWQTKRRKKGKRKRREESEEKVTALVWRAVTAVVTGLATVAPHLGGRGRREATGPPHVALVEEDLHGVVLLVDVRSGFDRREYFSL